MKSMGRRIELRKESKKTKIFTKQGNFDNDGRAKV
jgi:hypothetical protein